MPAFALPTVAAKMAAIAQGICFERFVQKLMALKIIDARKSGFPHDGHFGYVHLVFDRDIDVNPLRVSILKMIGREYLGESFPPKANWRPTRWHFFDAPMVARGDGESVFVLGPEVTSFIPDESMLEVASEDNSVREMAVWSGVSVDFSWKGPPPETAPVRQMPPVSPSVPRPIAREPQPPAMPAPPPAPPPQPPEPPPQPPEPSPPTTASPAPEAPPPPAPAAERTALSPFAWVRRGKPNAPAEPPPPVPTPEAEPVASAPELPAEPDPAPPEIADAPPLFLAEPVERPDTPAEPPSVPESDAVVSAPPEVPVEPAQAPPPLPLDETADASGQSADVAPALEPQPETESASATEPPPPVRNRAGRVAWALLIATVAILGGLLYVQQNRLKLCSSYETLCDAETLTVTKAQQCSAIRDCGAWVCLADYRTNYPNGRYKAAIDQISAEKGALCPSSIDLHNAYTPSTDTSHTDSSNTEASNTDTSADASSDDPPRRHRRRLRRCRAGSTSPACLRRFRQQQSK